MLDRCIITPTTTVINTLLIILGKLSPCRAIRGGNGDTGDYLEYFRCYFSPGPSLPVAAPYRLTVMGKNSDYLTYFGRIRFLFLFGLSVG
jgi:hypothetical protein